MHIEERIQRIRNMERCFDEVREALEKGLDNGNLWENIRTLQVYMDGGAWMADYISDERGELPPALKRGVLSEDALYNLLAEIEERDSEKKVGSDADE